MASDRKQFQRALRKWTELRRSGKLSVEPRFGITAVITSRFTDDGPETAAGQSELDSFHSEAYALVQRVQAAGGRASAAIDASLEGIIDLVQNPNVCSIYVVGNGSLSNLMLDVREYLDWQLLSAVTTHLKQGVFVQRQCGGLSRNLNVPLGTFAVNDFRNVHAAVGADAFYPQSLDDPENQKIRQVFYSNHLDYDRVKSLDRENAELAII